MMAACTSGSGDGGATAAGPSTSSPTTATTVAVPTSGGVEVPAAASEFDAWMRVGEGLVGPGSGFVDAAVAGGGLVVVGFDGPSDGAAYDGVVLRSVDGVSWERSAKSDSELVAGTTLVFAVAGGDSGLVAVGTGCDDGGECATNYPRIWGSEDGDVWARSAAVGTAFADQGSILDVIAVDAGWVAVGNVVAAADGGSRASVAAVWGSEEGSVWSRMWVSDPPEDDGVDPLPGFSSFARMNAVTVGADGLLVGVGLAESESGPVGAAAWTSHDGRIWDRADIDMGGLPATGTELSSVAAGNGGLVAVGTSDRAAPLIATSDNGRGWELPDTPAGVFDGTGSLADVAGLEGGFVAVGTVLEDRPDSSEVVLWGSHDGSDWARLETVDTGQAFGVLSTDLGLVVVGIASEPEAGGAIWTGPQPDLTDMTFTTRESAAVSAPSTVGMAPPHLGCEELLDRGFNYPEVISYWMHHGQPSEMDSPTGGPPCDETYPPGEIEAILGPSSRLSYEMNETEGVNEDRWLFEILGPAVDQGIICQTGIGGPGEQNLPPSEYGPLQNGTTLYTCDDGSGTFLILYELFIDLETYDGEELIGSEGAGIWRVISGTGDYTNLAGGGADTFEEVIIDWDTWESEYTQTRANWGFAKR